MLGFDDLILCAGTVSGTPFLDRLAPAREAGFASVSILPSDYAKLAESGIGPAEIRARVADAGLEIGEFDTIGRWLPDQKPNPSIPQWLSDALDGLTPEEMCEQAAACGARSITVVELYGVDYDAARMAERFAWICDLAAAAGTLVHLEFIPVGGIRTLAKAWEIVQLADRPNGGLLVDSWHLFRSGSTLEELARIPGEKIMGVQVNDAPAEPEADLGAAMVNSRLVPGEGSFDLEGFFRTLADIGCTAPIGVECMSERLRAMPPAEVARSTADATRNIMKRARKD